MDARDERSSERRIESRDQLSSERRMDAREERSIHTAEWDCYGKQYKRVLCEHVYDPQDENGPPGLSSKAALPGKIP